jgi:hypothetical protein
MCSWNQDLPFIFGDQHDLEAAVDGLARVAHSIDKGAGVSRVMQNARHLTVPQNGPYQLSLRGPA